MQAFFSIFLFSLLAFTGCSKSEKIVNEFYGNVDVRTVSLAFEVGGKIEAMNFEEGQSVKKGEVIATLNSTAYIAQLQEIESQVNAQKAKLLKLQNGYRKEQIAQAKATLAQKKALMKHAKKSLERHKELLASNSISQEVYDNVVMQYESAKALHDYALSTLRLLQNGYDKEDVAAAKAQLQALEALRAIRELNVEHTKLLAPSNGVVLTKAYEVGSVVNPSQSVVEMAKSDSYWVRSYLSERYLGLVKVGMRAVVLTDSANKYEGVVSYISPLAEFTPKSVQTQDLRTDLVYRFRVVLDKHDDFIKQGMPVTIKLSELKTDSL
jgi:HlyD family secretion protein